MKTYIITRFSIFDPESRSWVLTRDNQTNPDRLKELLFNPNRLNEKFWTFENITYYSVVNQKNSNYLWLIYISNELPPEYKNRIKKIENDNIKIIEVKSQSEFFKHTINYKYEKNFSTVRLDDDDGLNLNFIDIVNTYYQENSNDILSFPNGILITKKDNNLYQENQKKHLKKIAVGLSMFNHNIYNCGNHTELDKNFNVIYDNTPDMYLLYASDNCDTKRKFNFNDSSVFDFKKYFI